MSIYEHPEIKLELSALKQTVVMHLNEYSNILNKNMKIAVENAIQNFNFQSAIDNIVNEVINTELEKYFKYGEGKRNIEAAVKESLNQSLKH